MSISVSGLTKIYGEQVAVNAITFEIPKGQIVGFLGPNGAGKSTTMKMITGFLAPTSGTAQVCGMDVSTESLAIRKKLGYLPESNPLYYEMYVREYLGFCAGIHHLGKEKNKRIAEIISMTGLGPESHKKIGTLSRGYKQRVGLAQAMLHNPDVLILDEPTSGLDPNQIVEIRELIKNIGKEKTVLLSSHIMQEVKAMCDRVLIISKGNLVADDSIVQLEQGRTDNTILVGFDKEVEKTFWKSLRHLKAFKNLGAGRYELNTTAPDALRKELLQHAIENNLNILELQNQNNNLEDVFRQLTQ